MIVDIGQNLLNFVKAVVVLNNQFISTVLRIITEACRGLGILTAAVLQATAQILYYIVEVGKEVLHLGKHVIAACNALAVLLIQMFSILLDGLESIGAYIASYLSYFLRSGYQCCVAASQYLGLSSLDLQKIIHSGITETASFINSTVSELYLFISFASKSGIKWLAAILFTIRDGAHVCFKYVRQNFVVASRGLWRESSRIHATIVDIIPEDWLVDEGSDLAIFLDKFCIMLSRRRNINLTC